MSHWTSRSPRHAAGHGVERNGSEIRVAILIPGAAAPHGYPAHRASAARIHDRSARDVTTVAGCSSVSGYLPHVATFAGTRPAAVTPADVNGCRPYSCGWYQRLLSLVSPAGFATVADQLTTSASDVPVSPSSAGPLALRIAARYCASHGPIFASTPEFLGR